ncbi:hypothetical protein PybrP1_012542 [[Pythium] brassicae (nom. inval.)]|nr:hypothetical protein PybrP1_012542 [[Pythium] brassicae (nom. inval.)]
MNLEEAVPATALVEIFAFAHAPSLMPVTFSKHTYDCSRSGHCDFAKHGTAPSLAGLQTLALVSRAWRVAAEALLDQHLLQVRTLRFTVGSEDDEQKAIVAALRSDGDCVRDLRVEVAVARNKQRLWWEALDTPDAAGAFLEAQWIDWSALLQLMPNVRRLDLSRVPLHHFTLGDALRAAATCCTHVEALVLPKRDSSHADAVEATIDDTFQALFTALESWHSVAQRSSFPPDGATALHKTPSGPEESRRGIRQLTVPSHSAFDPETTSTRFLRAVATFCPTIEYLDGWKRSYRDKRFVTSDRSLCVSKETWTEFCERCARLREFSWVVVPFSDAFFVPFGATMKHQLTHLQLTYNVAAPFRIIRSEYSTDGLCALLPGCPALRVLDVVLHRIQSAHALVYPHLDEMIDGAVFDDVFVTQLARSCPRLESMRIRAVDTGYPMLNAITDKGIRALAGLERLRFIELLGAKCSASGILALATAFAASDVMASRVVKIRELGSRFGEIGTELFEILAGAADIAALQSCSKPLLISVESRRGFVFKKSFLDAVFTQMKKQFAHLRFVVLVTEKPAGKDKDAYSRLMHLTRASKDVVRIGKLALYTDTRLLSAKVQAKLSAHGDVCVVQP